MAWSKIWKNAWLFSLALMSGKIITAKFFIFNFSRSHGKIREICCRNNSIFHIICTWFCCASSYENKMVILSLLFIRVTYPGFDIVHKMYTENPQLIKSAYQKYKLCPDSQAMWSNFEESDDLLRADCNVFDTSSITLTMLNSEYTSAYPLNSWKCMLCTSTVESPKFCSGLAWRPLVSMGVWLVAG